VDGDVLPAALALPGVAVVGADGRSLAVAAASVVAKVLRDRVMRAWDRRHPGYGFAVNLGYPTRDHRLALERLGPCPLHRRTFRPVAQRIHQRLLPFS
jgi:ribonuclease HII